MSNGKTICTVCNYIYDEAIGEPSPGVKPVLKFADLPDEWHCPDCGAAKDMFQPCSCVSLPVCEPARARSSLAELLPGNSLAALPVGRLVAEHPEWACVFEQYNLDYCCNGKNSLQEACRNKGVSLDAVLEKLSVIDKNKLPADAQDWMKTSLRELIDHIVVCYHQPLGEELPRLGRLIEKVVRAHGDKHPKLLELADIFKLFREQLELHMQKEELILFPGISGIEAGGPPRVFGCGGGVEHPIEIMMQEHDDAGESLAKMRHLTNDYIPPADACETFKVLLHSLAKLELDMHQHVHKENNILFPRALELATSAVSTGK